LRDLRPEHLQRFYNEKIRQGLSARTVRYCHTLLYGALAQAEKNQLVKRNVSTLTSLPGEAHKEMQTLSLAQLTNILLPAIREDRLYAAIFLMFMTGLRRGELLALRWRDIDLHASLLHVRQTLARVRNHEAGGTQLVFSEPKTSLSRRQYPDPAGVSHGAAATQGAPSRRKLLLGQAYDDAGLVFCHPHGTALDPRTVNQRFSRMLRGARLPHIRLHDGRHSYATALMEQGVSPKVVQTMPGHSSVKMTLDIYSHVTLELEQQAAARLNAALPGGKS
jgi:integrase